MNSEFDIGANTNHFKIRLFWYSSWSITKKIGHEVFR